LAANIAEPTAAQVASSIKNMPAVQPQVTPEQSAPWARALLDSSSSSGLPIAEELSASSEEQEGDESSRFESQVTPETKSTPLRPVGHSDTGPMRAAGKYGGASAEPVVPQSAVLTESEPGRLPKTARTVNPAQTMTPQMAMASGEVAEFTVVKPDRMEVRIQDLQGDLELSVAREEEGLAVKVRAPQEIIEDFQGMESDLEAALSEDDQSLASFEAETNDQESASDSEKGEANEMSDSSPSAETHGARVLSRLA
jgi:hypothetical protein